MKKLLLTLLLLCSLAACESKRQELVNPEIVGHSTEPLTSESVTADEFSDTKALAEQGDVFSQGLLGAMYAYGVDSHGESVPQDDAEAIKWYRKAADQGFAASQNNLGIMYFSGRGVPQDYAEAAKWYRKAADQGFAASQFMLALSYDIGKGVPQDYAEAAKWYRRAADQGVGEAQFHLGKSYYEGKGVPQDYAEAYVWSSIAATLGVENAIENRDIVAKQLSPADLGAAQKRAAKLSEEIQQRK